MTDKNRKIEIMGIVNLTDDSYFAESRCADVSSALKKVETMLADGADIIDVGACSTRPGAKPVGEDEEWRRLEQFLKELRREFPSVRLSIDTYWSSVVRRAYNLIGDFIVNDISAGEADRCMLSTVGELALRYVAMHMRGNPETMNSLTDYNSIVGDVLSYFKYFSQKAAESGVVDWVLDPGFGFAKSLEQNYVLLNGLERFQTVRRADGTVPPVLVGISRKSMIYKRLSITPEESLPATQVAHFKALQCGADILRVHDVAEACRTVSLYRCL